MRRPRSSEIWLSGCAAVNSDGGTVRTCLPVVEYRREFQTLAAEELALLLNGSANAEVMADYAVMRDQALACVS